MVAAEILPGSRPVAQRAPRALFGIGVSAGMARGPARPVRSEADARSVRPGEVAVAAHLPAPWVPLLAAAAGVVGDGGPLCNTAIVLRELRLPAVMAAGAAVGAVAQGRVLTVDGTGGSVAVRAEGAA
jgi:phosphoenolpyruvate synthase/pyruvate phosphate dikinase